MAERLWIDGYAYGVRLLAGGEDPWRRPAELGLFLRELHGLLRPDVVYAPLGPAVTAWRGSGAGAAGFGSPADQVEGVLGAAAFSEYVRGGLRAAAGALDPAPLALAVPDLPVLAALAGVEGEAVSSPEALEAAGWALGDLVRGLSEARLSWLVLDTPSPGLVELLEPTLASAAHYGWRTAVVGSGADWPADLTLPVSEADWSSADTFGALAGLEALFVRIPADAQPETVLAAAGRLRGAG